MTFYHIDSNLNDLTVKKKTKKNNQYVQISSIKDNKLRTM